MMSEIIKGFKAYFGAYEIISRLKLWKYFAIPMILSLLVAICIGSISYALSDTIGNYVAGFWAWEFGKTTVETISTVFGGLLILTLGFITFKHIILALSAPFMGPISKKIEDDYIKGTSETKVSSSLELLVRGIRISVRNLMRELILTIPILLIGLIPVIGLFSTVLLFLMQAYFAGFGNMDYTLERHFSYKESVLFVKRNRGIATGNGIVFMLFLLIPFIGVILVLPFSVTAATLETIKLIEEKK
tara:strand:+ start:11667 stop:12404 length:738 start_codon:yes stop_codon:yes gene_type:complete